MAASVSANEEKARERAGKALTGIFPFRDNAQHDGHAEHHHHHHEGHQDAFALPAARSFEPPARGQRQGSGDEVALDIGSIAAAGERFDLYGLCSLAPALSDALKFAHDSFSPLGDFSSTFREFSVVCHRRQKWVQQNGLRITLPTNANRTQTSSWYGTDPFRWRSPIQGLTELDMAGLQ